MYQLPKETLRKALNLLLVLAITLSLLGFVVDVKNTQDLRKQNLSLQPKRSVGKQSQTWRRLRRYARNDIIS
ncbi:MAG: hypothetical protein KME23_23675 [Goleter apudmare HA4340-LM2]|jgi:hypothetical protein|nr:hypothetical protein [Goleter apudmare HA4340-LM2]